MAKTREPLNRDELIQQLADAKAELKFGKHAKTSEIATPIILGVIKWGSLTTCVYFGYLSIAALAGKETNAVFDIKMLLDSNILGIIFGSGGIVYGWMQKRLKQKVIERLQPRIQNYEQQIDVGRTSSLLTERGETNPADE